jgi:hypothetical protein
MLWGWKLFDFLLVLGALLVIFGVWFIPSIDSSPDVQAFYERQRLLKEKRLAVEAEEARIKKEQEDLGLVFIPPPPARENRNQ